MQSWKIWQDYKVWRPARGIVFLITRIMEIWKDIPGQEWKYQVSTIGRARSLDRRMINRSVKWRMLKTCDRPYPMVSIGKRNRKNIHRLVAITFLDPVLWKNDVNHINGIKTDNRVENLEWCNMSENKIHSYKVLGNVTHNKWKKFVNWHYL